MNNLILKKRTSASKRKYIIIGLMLFLTVGMSIGYAYVRKDLNVNGKVNLVNTNSTPKEVTILGIDGQEAYYDDEPSPYVASETGIDFSKQSSDTNGRGLYIYRETKESDTPIYYYRGEVNNNNVVFAGFCWKIVRTTGTGGTKLIYNGVASGNKCATGSGGTSATIGSYSFNSSTSGTSAYMTSTTASSTAKTQIDTWYEKFLNSYTDKLEDAVWCNDIGIYNTVGIITLYGGYGRLVENSLPSPISCSANSNSYTVNESASGNGLLTYPVGMITADEVVLGGIVADSYKTTQTSYLYTGSNYWTMTPSGKGKGTYSSHLFVVDSHGYIYDYTGGEYNAFYAELSPDAAFKGIFFQIESSGYLYVNSASLGRIGLKPTANGEIISTGYLTTYVGESSSPTYGENTTMGNQRYTIDSTTTYEGVASYSSYERHYINSSTSYYGSSIAYFANTNVTVPLGIRPSIVLKSGTKPTQGDGTPGNPYIVE